MQPGRPQSPGVVWGRHRDGRCHHDLRHGEPDLVSFAPAQAFTRRKGWGDTCALRQANMLRLFFSSRCTSFVE